MSAGAGRARAPDDGAEPLDLRLVPAAVVAWLVAWQVRAVPPAWAVVLALGAAAAGAALLLHRPSRAGRRQRMAAGTAAALLCAGAAGLCTAARTGARSAEPVAGLAERRAAVTVEAVLTDDPRRAAAATAGRPLVVAQVRAERLEAAGRAHRVRVPLVVLSSQEQWLGLLPGQQVRVEGRLRPAEPGDHVAAVLSGRGPPRLLGRPGLLQRAAGRLRAGLRDAVAVLPAAERGLLPGLVVGDTSGLDPALREDFRATGLSHLVAVSGTNVAIVVGATLLVARRAGLGLRAAPVVAAVALVGFVVLARPSPSVLRAAVMGAVGLLALATGGRRRAVPALAASVLLLVLLDPDLAATAGFALSVLATAGLLLLAPSWRPRLARRMPRWLADALAVPAAAQVACGPVVVAISGTLGLLSVPANLLAVPAVAPATVLGVACALTAPVLLPLAQALAWVAFLPAAWLVLVARRGADLPGAQLDWPDGAAGATALAVLTLLVAVSLPRRRVRRLLAAGTAGSLLAVIGLAAVRPGWPPPGWFLVTCDVGQGDAHVLNAGAGAAVVVDAGPQPEAVDGCLRRLSVRVVPLVVLTHLHADHVEGLPGVLRGRDVHRLEVGPLADPPQQWDRLRAQAAAAGLPLEPVALGQARRAGPVRWEVVAPVRAYRGTRSDPNNSSVVLRVHAGPVRVLLTGDVEPEAQAELLRVVPDLRSDVLKLPHHGSRHQDTAFLAAVRPRVVLTSVGADNDYGHPSADVLGALLAAGARSYRTDLDGDVALVLRDGRLLAVGRRGDGQEPGPRPDRAEPPAPAASPWGVAGEAGRRPPRRGAPTPLDQRAAGPPPIAGAAAAGGAAHAAAAGTAGVPRVGARARAPPPRIAAPVGSAGPDEHGRPAGTARPSPAVQTSDAWDDGPCPT